MLQGAGNIVMMLASISRVESLPFMQVQSVWIKLQRVFTRFNATARFCPSVCFKTEGQPFIAASSDVVL